MYLNENLFNSLIEEYKNLNIYHYSIDEDHSGSKIYSNILQKFISNGRIDLRGQELKDIDDIVFVSKLFRDTRFEIFRILYIKDNKVIANEGITCQLPDFVSPIGGKPKFNNGIEKLSYYYNSKLKKFEADGYYIFHNHPDGNVQLSEEDIQTNKLFETYINGYFGSIIVGIDKIHIVTPNINKIIPISNDELYVNDIKIDNFSDIYSQCIDSTKFSTLLYIDSQGYLIFTEELNNTEFNDKNIFRYISNQKIKNGACTLFLYTKNEDVFEKSYGYILMNIFTNVFLEIDNNIISGREYLHTTKDPSVEYTSSGKKYTDVKWYHL